MRCRKCGRKIKYGSNFCDTCGCPVKHKKRWKKRLWIIFQGFVLGVIIGAGILLFKNIENVASEVGVDTTDISGILADMFFSNPDKAELWENELWINKKKVSFPIRVEELIECGAKFNENGGGYSSATMIKPGAAVGEIHMSLGKTSFAVACVNLEEGLCNILDAYVADIYDVKNGKEIVLPGGISVGVKMGKLLQKWGEPSLSEVVDNSTVVYTYLDGKINSNIIKYPTDAILMQTSPRAVSASGHKYVITVDNDTSKITHIECQWGNYNKLLGTVHIIDEERNYDCEIKVPEVFNDNINVANYHEWDNSFFFNSITEQNDGGVFSTSWETRTILLKNNTTDKQLVLSWKPDIGLASYFSDPLTMTNDKYDAGAAADGFENFVSDTTYFSSEYRENVSVVVSKLKDAENYKYADDELLRQLGYTQIIHPYIQKGPRTVILGEFSITVLGSSISDAEKSDIFSNELVDLYDEAGGIILEVIDSVLNQI